MRWLVGTAVVTGLVLILAAAPWWTAIGLALLGGVVIVAVR